MQKIFTPALLTQEQLARLVFPLAGLNKARVRELARTAARLYLESLQSERSEV